MTTVIYTATKPYAKKRPWADVDLQPLRAGSHVLKCLVDTGADYLQINAADATAAGISLAGAVATSVSTAGTKTILQLVKGVRVSIEGSKSLTVDLLVDTTNSTAPPLAGRQLLMAAFEIGFNPTEWLST